MEESLPPVVVVTKPDLATLEVSEPQLTVRAVARNLKQVGAHVIGVTRHGKPHPGVDESVASDRLDDVLPRADYVFVATPATPETVDLLNRDRLSRMKPGAGLVNVGRAGWFQADTACPIAAGTWPGVVASAGAALAAAAAVLGGRREAYALCRPPGHHDDYPSSLQG